MAKFLSELKRRNVFKVATIYVVVSWLLLQVATIIFPVFEIPLWASRLVVVLLGLGFPLAMILAWAFNLTPEGIEWDAEVGEKHVHTHVWDWVLGVLLVVAIGLIVGSEIRNWQEPPAAAVEREAAIVESPADVSVVRNSIAVLPFVNMSGDPENEFFSDGLTEEILNLLAQIPELKVIGRTSSFAFKGKNVDLREIGSTLGVTTLLEGSVRKSGNQIRVTAQLIDVTDATHIWSQTYNRTLTDIFEVQDDVAASIIGAMELLDVANPSRGRPTENTDAYSLFLKARIATNNYDWQAATSLLNEAIALDPSFAEAYELLAACYWSMGGTTYSAQDAQKLTADTASQALAINPEMVLARALYLSADPENYTPLRKLEAFETAARLRPENQRILDIYWYSLFQSGYLRDALQIAQRRVLVDPLSISASGRLPVSLFSVGRTEDGFEALKIFEQLQPGRSHWFVGENYLAFNRDQLAISTFEENLAANGNTDTGWIADLVTGGRDPVTGQDYLDSRIAEIIASVPPEHAEGLRYNLQYWYLYFGHLDKYFDRLFEYELDKSKWFDADDLITSGTGYRHLGFTAHARYLEAAEKLGYLEIWDQRGAPDFCRKETSDWICD
jgi:TolB-like protein